MNLLKVPRFHYKNALYYKEHLDLLTEVLKGFSPSVFKRPCVTHSKSSKNGNLESKSELIIFFFFKVALKASIVSSDS